MISLVIDVEDKLKEKNSYARRQKKRKANEQTLGQR